ncbi:MAG: hypothetical protein R3C03_08835 [Pirellulaceae bacterium]
MFSRKKKSESRSGIGFRYVSAVGIIVILLLFINGLLVRAFVNANMSSDGDADLRYSQAVQYLMPLVLIIVEFWVFDRMAQAIRRR